MGLSSGKESGSALAQMGGNRIDGRLCRPRGHAHEPVGAFYPGINLGYWGVNPISPRLTLPAIAKSDRPRGWDWIWILSSIAAES